MFSLLSPPSVLLSNPVFSFQESLCDRIDLTQLPWPCFERQSKNETLARSGLEHWALCQTGPWGVPKKRCKLRGTSWGPLVRCDLPGRSGQRQTLYTGLCLKVSFKKKKIDIVIRWSLLGFIYSNWEILILRGNRFPTAFPLGKLQDRSWALTPQTRWIVPVW